MKERYTKPVANIDEFKTVDIVTTSNGDLQPDDNVVKPWD